MLCSGRALVPGIGTWGLMTEVLLVLGLGEDGGLGWFLGILDLGEGGTGVLYTYAICVFHIYFIHNIYSFDI